MATSKQLVDHGFVQLCSENGNSLPGYKTISEANQQGLWHKAIHIIVVDASTKKILAQQRSPLVKVHPSRVELSTGGAVAFGESPEEACVRELFEEVGIETRTTDLQPLFQNQYNHYLSRLGLHTKIVLYSYLLKLPATPLLRFRDHEVSKAVFITPETAYRLADKEIIPNLGELSPQYAYYTRLLKSVEETFI